jgi:DNA-binding MarR family transcriptional regulator/GNAT superfamily N-acetyltransferase
MEDRVAAVRAFNRFYTGVIGVLGDGLLETPYSLTEARVIFELAQTDAMDLVDLRRLLGVDAGYLSRVVGGFESDGLLKKERSATDGRRQVIRLTARGRAMFTKLDERSAGDIGALLSRLAHEDQRRLLGAMDVIRQVLSDMPRSESFVLRAPEPGDLGWVLQRHGAVYAQEYGWDETFEALVARIVADYAEHRDPKREAAWIAEVNGERAGCVLCVKHADKVAKLRLLLVEPAARGLGIGGRLVDECLRFARRTGYDEMVLWTQEVLVDARRIYERAGFAVTERQPHHSFGHDLVAETWSRPL